MFTPYTRGCVWVHVWVRACGKSGNSAVKVTVRPDYCRDVLIERFRAADYCLRPRGTLKTRKGEEEWRGGEATEIKKTGMWQKINKVIEIERKATSKGFEWGGNQGQASNAEREKKREKDEKGKKGGTERMSDNDRERGRKGGRAGGGGGEWDLRMIIRLLGKTLTENFLSTSWSPDSTPPLSSFLPPPPIPPPVPPPHLHHPYNPLCLVFSFSSSQRHCSLIIESLLSKSKTWRHGERERESGGERPQQATIMWLLSALPFTFTHEHIVHACCSPFSTGGLKCPKWINKRDQ